MSHRVPVALLFSACVLLALAATAEAATARSWTLRRDVSVGHRYELVLRFAPGPRHRRGADTVLVTGTPGLRRIVDASTARAGVVRVALWPRAARLAIHVRARHGRPRLARVALRRLPLATGTVAGAPATSSASALSAAPTPAADAATSLVPSGRKLLFDDEFDGAASGLPADSAWDPQEGAGWGPGQLQSYTGRARNVGLDGDGHLAITARKETYTGPDGETVGYTSARLQTLGRFSFMYGRVEARMKLPAGDGLWPAFWMLGNDIYTKGWPECGEIDVMETIGSIPDQLHGTVHGPSGPWASDPDADGEQWQRGEALDDVSSLTTQYHVYAAEWKPDSIELSLDGKVYFTITKGSLSPSARWTFDHPNHLLLNMAVGGDWPGAPTASTTFPASLLVDWVRVYAPAA